MTELLSQLEVDLEEIGDADRAAQMAAYMKDQFPFLGVAAKPRRDALRPAIGAAKAASAEELLDAAEWCWTRDPRELQYCGCDLLRAGAASLEPEHLPRVRALVESKSWWDTVDTLASHTVGTMVDRNRSLSPTMDAWIDDENFWVARVAILHQLGWKDHAEPDRLFGYAERRAADTEFFIRKALGWALRNLARDFPNEVRRFVDEHRGQLSGLTIREATKHL